MKQTHEKRTLVDRVIKWPQAGIVLALIILYLILAFAPTPAKNTFFLSGNIINVVRQSAIMIVIGIPITFTLAAGLLDLSIGSLACLGAVVTCAFITGHSSSQMEICPQVPLGVAILIGMAVSAFFWLAERLDHHRAEPAAFYRHARRTGNCKGRRPFFHARLPGLQPSDLCGRRSGPRHTVFSSLYRLSDGCSAGRLLDYPEQNALWPSCLRHRRQR